MKVWPKGILRSIFIVPVRLPVVRPVRLPVAVELKIPVQWEFQKVEGEVMVACKAKLDTVKPLLNKEILALPGSKLVIEKVPLPGPVLKKFAVGWVTTDTAPGPLQSWEKARLTDEGVGSTIVVTAVGAITGAI